MRAKKDNEAKCNNKTSDKEIEDCHCASVSSMKHNEKLFSFQYQ